MKDWEQYYAENKKIPSDCTALIAQVDCLCRDVPPSERCASCQEYEALYLDWKNGYRPLVSKNPDANWANDEIQFPRLIAEIAALQSLDNWVPEVVEAMDLTREQVCEIIDRACDKWDKIKEKT